VVDRDAFPVAIAAKDGLSEVSAAGGSTSFSEELLAAVVSTEVRASTDCFSNFSSSNLSDLISSAPRFFSDPESDFLFGPFFFFCALDLPNKC
jgi:hypothetical protein